MAVCVGVAPHKRRVLFLVNHDIVHLKTYVLKEQALPKAGQGSSAVDFVPHDPDNDAPSFVTLYKCFAIFSKSNE